MARIFRQWLCLCALLLAASCGSRPPAPPPGPGPALWRIEGKDIDGWLFGTIHVLPRNVEWRTPTITDAIGRSDRLILESAQIQDPAAVRALFEDMGRSPGLPALESRLPATDRKLLDRLLVESGNNSRSLSAYESWAAAMLLSSAAEQSMHLSPDAGVEPVLIESFRAAAKPIGGLETVQRQFSAFDRLPETAQRQLLTQTVRDAQGLPQLYGQVLTAWMKGDIDAIARAEQSGAAPDPAIIEAVLVARNRDWVKAIGHLRGRPFIAVGTGHLTGPDNLVQLLKAHGYKVTRVR